LPYIYFFKRFAKTYIKTLRWTYFCPATKVSKNAFFLEWLSFAMRSILWIYFWLYIVSCSSILPGGGRMFGTKRLAYLSYWWNHGSRYKRKTLR